jgi:LytR cell envelope-related transcriptional attenuator
MRLGSLPGAVHALEGDEARGAPRCLPTLDGEDDTRSDSPTGEGTAGRVTNSDNPVATMPPYTVYGVSAERTRHTNRLLAVGALLVAVVIAFGFMLSSGSGSSTASKGKTAPAKHHAAATGTKTHTATRPDLAAQSRPTPQPVKRLKPAHHPTVIPPPSKTPVMVLNANGVTGAAASAAANLQRYGYATPVVGDARTRGLPTTIQYRPGYGPAARSLARRVGNVQYVTPLDGYRESDLHGADLILILGP